MGKFLKYEDSNFRTFVINLNAADDHGTIKRPKRPITTEDLLGAIVDIEGVEVIVNVVADGGNNIMFNMPIDTDGTPGKFKYSKTNDTFSYESGESPIPLTNIMIDEFGRELVTLE